MQAKTTAVKQGTKQRPMPEGRRWKKGQSGNPKGRPPNQQSITALLRAQIDEVSPDDKEGKTWAELIVLATMRLAMAGNSTALKEVWERMDGKVTTPIELDSPDPAGVPLIRVEFVGPAGNEREGQADVLRKRFAEADEAWAWR